MHFHLKLDDEVDDTIDAHDEYDEYDEQVEVDLIDETFDVVLDFEHEVDERVENEIFQQAIGPDELDELDIIECDDDELDDEVIK